MEPRLTSPDRLITAKDHASVQITVADVDADGKAIKGQGTVIALCGQVRSQGEADDVSLSRAA
jgi:small subunit ribosomal protein S21e